MATRRRRNRPYVSKGRRGGAVHVALQAVEKKMDTKSNDLPLAELAPPPDLPKLSPFAMSNFLFDKLVQSIQSVVGYAGAPAQPTSPFRGVAPMVLDTPRPSQHDVPAVGTPRPAEEDSSPRDDDGTPAAAETPAAGETLPAEDEKSVVDAEEPAESNRASLTLPPEEPPRQRPRRVPRVFTWSKEDILESEARERQRQAAAAAGRKSLVSQLIWGR